MASNSFEAGRFFARARSFAVTKTLLLAVWSALAGGSTAAGQDIRTREYPPDIYYRALDVYTEGEFSSAARGFRDAARSGMRSTEGRWVDSICYHAMLGECFYQMGELGPANEEFAAALNLFLAYRNWMLRVDFEPGLEADRVGPRRAITWGVSARRAVPARFPGRYPILQGRNDNVRVLQQGGTFALPEYYLINAHEIMRCTALAIRRRHEIMGRATAHDPLTAQLVQALAVRPAPPNHWSGAWVDALLGLAYASSGRNAEALSELNKGVVAAARFDHPLTPTVLFALGKIAFEQEQYGNAQNFFLEASYSAAWFSQYALVEESLRWGALTHIVTGQNGMYRALEPATAWAHRESDFLKASLLVSAAEISATAGETSAAMNLLQQSWREMVRADMRGGALGARYQYVLALANYQTGNHKAGNIAFTALMQYQRKNSFRLFELGLVDHLATSGAVTERVANQLYQSVLREPAAKDWVVEPVETLSMVLTPHSGPLEHWLEVALKRKETERAIEITDRIRRHRFFTTLPMGGRLVALRWVLEAPEASLSDRTRLQRKDLLVRYPKYAELAREVAGLRKKLGGMPLVPEDEGLQQTQKELMANLANLSTTQEVLLREIALHRVPADFVFPPELDFKALKDGLPPKSLVISFLVTSRSVHVFSLGKDKYSHWQVEGGNKLRKNVADLLRGIGHIDKNQAVDLGALQSDAWKTPAKDLLAALTNNAEATTWDDVDELVIVPDGPLWYVPFETLQVGGEGDTDPLISKARIRYAPTVALSMPDKRPSKPAGETAVVVGRLFPRDGEEISQAAFEQLRSVMPGATRLPDQLTVPSGLLAAFCDRLVVLTDIQIDSPGAYDWSPMQLDRGKLGSALSNWMTLPWGSPEQVVLPGFHTPAEVGLKRGGTGEEVFLSVCGLMASGSRTVLLSRWRTGGQTSYDLVREFVQELPYTSASNAWQRSVFLSRQDELFVEREPRVKPSNVEVSVKSDHPFFWAGYVLVDTGSSPRTDDEAKGDAVAEARDPGK
jgi:tetratricopeptide (TPR) repeat protein